MRKSIVILFIATPSAAASASCVSDDSMPTSADLRQSQSAVSAATFDANETQITRVHDLIMLPHANLTALRDLEISVFKGPFRNEKGHRIVSIYATGWLVAQLKDFGFVPVGHTPATGDLPPCDETAISPITTQLFASYDDVPGAFRKGVAKEVASMHNPTKGVAAKSVGTTVEGRPIEGVRFGLTTPGFELVAQSAVNVLGTYHAREWVAEEVAIRVARWAHRSLVPGSPYTE